MIKLGLDLHAWQVTECRQLDSSTPKPAQKWDPWKLLDKVEEWVKAGIPRSKSTLIFRLLYPPRSIFFTRKRS